jgi:TolB protein
MAAVFSSGAEVRAAALSSRLGTIVFARLHHHNWELYAMSGDGSGKRRLTHNRARDVQPAISPDGRKIAFVSTRHGGEDIYVMRTNGTRVHRLTHDRHVIRGRRHNSDAEPAFSPSGKRITFVSDRKAFPNIFLMRADGSHQQRLTRGSHFDLSPSFSSDGRRIAFASSPELLSQIFTMRRDGTHIRKLTQGGFNDGPAFSPVAPEIAYAKAGGGAAGDIWLMRSGGSRNHAVTQNPQDETRPAFSPGGEKIAFEKAGDIFTINADGSDLQRLTHTSDMEVEPSWGE